MNLLVRVNDELALDAGTTEEVDSSDLVIHPPKVTLLRQVLDYLQRKPDPPGAPTTVSVEDEGAAAAVVALRWGSYLAVLIDGAKPIWSEARSPGTSRISDAEMARINIEASAGLADWIEISREDRGMYERLVARALAYLPFSKMRPRPVGAEFAMLALPDVAAKMIEATTADRLARARGDAQAHPSRVFANVVVEALPNVRRRSSAGAGRARLLTPPSPWYATPLRADEAGSMFSLGQGKTRMGGEQVMTRRLGSVAALLGMVAASAMSLSACFGSSARPSDAGGGPRCLSPNRLSRGARSRRRFDVAGRTQHGCTIPVTRRRGCRSRCWRRERCGMRFDLLPERLLRYPGKLPARNREHRMRFGRGNLRCLRRLKHVWRQWDAPSLRRLRPLIVSQRLLRSAGHLPARHRGCGVRVRRTGLRSLHGLRYV